MREPEERKADLWSHVGSLHEWEMLVGHCTACGHKADVDPRRKPGVHLRLPLGLYSQSVSMLELRTHRRMRTFGPQAAALGDRSW